MPNRRRGQGGGNVSSRADWSTMPLSRQQGEGGGFALRRARAATKDPHQAKVNNNTYPIMARSEPATHYDFYALDDSQFGRKRLQGVHD